MSDISVIAPDSITAEKPTRAFYRRPAFAVFLIVLTLLCVTGALYWLDARQYESTDDASIDGHIVAINPQISAMVATVHITENQFVHQGELLIELDPRDYQIALNQASGAEAAAKGKVEEARSSVTSAKAAAQQAQAEVTSAQTNHDTAERDYKRFQGLDERSRSQKQEDDALANEQTTAAALELAKARLASALAQGATADASVLAAEGDYEKAKADTQQAQTRLSYCRITAPSDGRITEKNVEPGMYITPASSLFAIVPTAVWVTANFKETQLTLMRPGQPVTITVDAFPDRQFSGTLNSIQAGTGSRFSVVPAENATGNFVKVVQRIPVRIEFSTDPNADPARLLSPGMSVEAKVRVRDSSSF